MVKVTSGASIELKMKSISLDPRLDLRRVPKGKAREGLGGSVSNRYLLGNWW